MKDNFYGFAYYNNSIMGNKIILNDNFIHETKRFSESMKYQIIHLTNNYSSKRNLVEAYKRRNRILKWLRRTGIE